MFFFYPLKIQKLILINIIFHETFRSANHFYKVSKLSLIALFTFVLFKFVINEGMQTLSKTLKKLDNKRESKT